MTARVVPDDGGGRASAIEVAQGRRHRRAAHRYRVRHRGGADQPERDRAPVRGEAPADRQGGHAAARRCLQAPEAGVMTPAASALAAAFWPGGLSLVVPQRPDVAWPSVLTGGAATIGLRVADHDAPRMLARGVGPLPTTSANVSGVARGRRRGGDRGSARRRGGSRARRGPRARRAGLDGRGVRRAPATHPAGRRGPARGDRLGPRSSGRGASAPGRGSRGLTAASRSGCARRRARYRRSRRP